MVVDWRRILRGQCFQENRNSGLKINIHELCSMNANTLICGRRPSAAHFTLCFHPEAWHIDFLKLGKQKCWPSTLRGIAHPCKHTQTHVHINLQTTTVKLIKNICSHWTHSHRKIRNIKVRRKLMPHDGMNIAVWIFHYFANPLLLFSIMNPWNALEKPTITSACTFDSCSL